MMTITETQKAYDVAKNYQAGFDHRNQREAELKQQPLNSLGEHVTFTLVGGPGNLPESDRVDIIVDFRERRVWTNFVEGAGARCPGDFLEG